MTRPVFRYCKAEEILCYLHEQCKLPTPRLRKILSHFGNFLGEYFVILDSGIGGSPYDDPSPSNPYTYMNYVFITVYNVYPFCMVTTGDGENDVSLTEVCELMGLPDVTLDFSVELSNGEKHPLEGLSCRVDDALRDLEFAVREVMYREEMKKGLKGEV